MGRWRGSTRGCRLSATIPVLYQKIETYNLKYRDREGMLRPVRFGSYIWKRIDGLAIDYLKKEKRTEKVPRIDLCNANNHGGEWINLT